MGILIQPTFTQVTKAASRSSYCVSVWMRSMYSHIQRHRKSEIHHIRQVNFGSRTKIAAANATQTTVFYGISAIRNRSHTGLWTHQCLSAAWACLLESSEICVAYNVAYELITNNKLRIWNCAHAYGIQVDPIKANLIGFYWVNRDIVCIDHDHIHSVHTVGD